MSDGTYVHVLAPAIHLDKTAPASAHVGDEITYTLTVTNPGNTPLAMRLARVAEGELDAALSTTPKHDWDLAAGDLLVHEAGGAVTGLNGEIFTYNRTETRQANYVASSHTLHATLLEQLAAS